MAGQRTLSWCSVKVNAGGCQRLINQGAETVEKRNCHVEFRMLRLGRHSTEMRQQLLRPDSIRYVALRRDVSALPNAKGSHPV